MKDRRTYKFFSPVHHIPVYSAVMLKALLNPLLIYFALIGNAALLIAAWLFLHFEYGGNRNLADYSDALWWAISTVTTVGYGDIVPQTMEGRIIGMILMLIGVILFVSSTAILVANVLRETEEKGPGIPKQLIDQIESLEEDVSKIDDEGQITLKSIKTKIINLRKSLDKYLDAQ